MTQQHVIVAAQRAVSRRTREEVTRLHRLAQHAPTFVGSVKEMQPIDADVPAEPPEMVLPSMTARELFQRLQTILAPAWDLTATRDRSNMDATGDIVVDGRVVVEGVPVSTLLSLEKQLDDMRTVITNMPTRSAAKVWTFDEAQGFYRGPEVRNAKTRKVVKPLVVIPPTDKHPGQGQTTTVDETVGHYVVTEFSGALSAKEKETLVDRVNEVADAVKAARVEANRTEVTELKLGSKLLGAIFDH